MSERGQRATVIKALKPIGGFAVENSVGPGTPDVSYIGGWIELKWLRDWPKRSDTPVRFPHYTVKQRMWGQRYWDKGGCSWLLLQRRREWLLFTAPVAAEYVGNVPRGDLYEVAFQHWTEGLNAKELRNCLGNISANWDGF
jgi:hypothetical protein